MGFLNPLWLLLGVSISVPLILHLLQRHQGPRVVFPAVRYLKRAEREHARRIRLRQLVLLLLRIAALLLLAGAAARPFLRSAGANHAPMAVVIVLDNSMSSALVKGDRRVLDELKDRALETLQRAGPDDRFWLLRAGAAWEPALPGDARTIALRVRETQPTASRSNLIDAAARARSILAQGSQGRASEIQILSDLQASNMRGTFAGQRNGNMRVVVWNPERKAEPNASINGVVLGGGLPPRAGERSTVVVDIGGNLRDSVNVRLSIDGRTTGAAIATPGSSAVLALPPRAAGLISGEVEIDADALRMDDRRYFVATINAAPRVMLAGSLPFVSQALDVLANAKRITRAASDADVVIAPGGTAATTAPSIVVLAPASPLELPAVNRRLAAAGIDWRYVQRPPADLGLRGTSASDELLRSLANVRVMKPYALTRASRATADTVLLRLEDGSPYAVRGDRARGGRFVLLASSLTPDATTLPTSTAMIPLLDRLTGAWSAPAIPRSEVLPGERVSMPASADEVILPSGARTRVGGGEGFSEANVPGLYRVVSMGKVIGAFVVNPVPAESELRYSRAASLKRALPGVTLIDADNAEAWRKSIFTSRVGKEIWRGLILALLLLLLAEGVVAAGERGAAVQNRQAA